MGGAVAVRSGTKLRLRRAPWSSGTDSQWVPVDWDEKGARWAKDLERWRAMRAMRSREMFPPEQV